METPQSVTPTSFVVGATNAQATVSATLNGPLGGLTVAQASSSALFRTPFVGSTTTQASTSAPAPNLRLGLVSSAGKASSTAILVPAGGLIGATVAQAIWTGAPRLLLSGGIVGQSVFLAFKPGTALSPSLFGGLSGQATLALSGTRLALATLAQPAVIVAQGSTFAFLVGTSSVFVDLGVWPAGSYVLKTRCRTDATGTPAALQVVIRAAGTLIASGVVFTAGDTASASYPTDWANYAAQISFSLIAPLDVTVQWTNPATYHAAGKHLWLKGAQLHRLS